MQAPAPLLQRLGQTRGLAGGRRLMLLLEMGLSADLDELDRRVAADPAFLQELKAPALAYLAHSRR